MDKTGGIFPIPTCDYVCVSCGHQKECFIYAFEAIGRKLNKSLENDTCDYRDAVKEIQTNLERTIKAVRKRATNIGLESSYPSKYKTSVNQDYPPVMLLTREFTDKSYELIQEIRSREEIQMDVQGHLRELQFHHTVVITEICRAIAVLSKTSGKEKPGIIAEVALKSLYRCTYALNEISRIIPEKKEEVIQILDLSSRIECEIQLQFL